jgi:hypothetical protein
LAFLIGQTCKLNIFFNDLLLEAFQLSPGPLLGFAQVIFMLGLLPPQLFFHATDLLLKVLDLDLVDFILLLLMPQFILLLTEALPLACQTLLELLDLIIFLKKHVFGEATGTSRGLSLKSLNLLLKGLAL